MRDEIERQLRDGAELKLRVAEELTGQIQSAAEALIECVQGGGKALFCGNGGSAADAQHLAAELIGRFKKERAAIPAVALTTDSSVLTALGNDYGYERVFSRQVEALGQAGDLLVAISTSGRSPNALLAAKAARRRGMKTVALTGRGGGKLGALADICIPIPSTDAARIQEAHIAVGHILCDLLEQRIGAAS